jgi:Family of unknown function (DUF5329)
MNAAKMSAMSSTITAAAGASARGLLLVLVLLTMGVPASADPAADLETRKIEFLITAVATLPGAEFIRNGTAYGAKAAADHLRRKLHAAGSRVATANDFIRVCATASSTTGSPYQIRFEDGRTVTAEAFLRQKLVEFVP